MTPDIDWSKVEVAADVPRKNPSYNPPVITDNIAWLKDIYQGILLMSVADNDDGLRHWTEKLAHGVTRDQIIAYFRGVAESENAKLGGGTVQAPSQDFWSLIDRTTGRKRALLVIKQSIGDCLIITTLLESFHETHQGYDLYIATEPKYFPIFDGCPHVFKVIPYLPQMENEMIMIGSGQVEGYFSLYMHPAVQSQRHLNYLSNDKIAFNLEK